MLRGVDQFQQGQRARSTLTRSVRPRGRLVRLRLPSLQLRVSDSVPDELRGRAEYVLVRLRLRDDERLVSQRREWYQMYQSGKLSEGGLAGKALLISAAIERM